MALRRRGLLISVVRIVALSYAGLTALLFVFQRQYIYYPDRAPREQLEARAGRDGLAPWRAEGERLIGWWTPAADARVLVFHGNAGSAVDRSYFVWAFNARPAGRSWQVCILEYPGYGAREGAPGERTMVAAGLEALDALLAESERPVILLGESLGSGVAAQVAAARPDRVAGLLLLTPFSTLADAAAVHYPYLPVRWMLRDRFDSVAALRGYAGPVAVVVAEHDRVVPARLGRRLVASYDGPTRLFEQAGRDHNTLELDPGADWWEDAVTFLLPAAREDEALSDGGR